MTWSYALIAASALVLAACQPATETPEPTVPTPPPPPATTETIAAPIAPETPTAETEPTPEAHDHANEHDHDDHSEHNGDKDHAHEDHDHHDHAGGEAHVHGHGDLAVTRDGNTITVSLEAPLANFGLSEAETNIGDSSVYADQAVTLNGGNCLRTERSVGAQSDGQHGKMTIDLTFSCDDASDVTGIDVTALNAFSGFSEIDAVILTETDQAAATLTKTNTVIEFP